MTDREVILSYELEAVKAQLPLFKQHLEGLVQDALDAIEIDARNTAKRRLQAVLRALKT